MLQLFQEFVTPEQKKLATMVEKMGGEAALENELSMRELADAEVALSAPSGSESRHSKTRPYDLVELQQEIKGSPEEAIEQNAELFSRKFDIQRRQIVEDIERSMTRHGDRIISAVTAGPHDRIVDSVGSEGFYNLHELIFTPMIQDIYNIWKDMVSNRGHPLQHLNRTKYRDGAEASSRAILLWH